MLDTIKNYIEKYKADLKDNNFDAFYSHMKVKSFASQLTRVFLDINVDPLEYMSKIPESYGQGLPKFRILNIPPQIKSIGEYAFGDCAKLTEAKLPEGLLAIRSKAFQGCSNLRKINLPESCLFIGSGAFQNTAISSINLPKLANIYQSTFSGCTQLKEIQFNDSISFIGQSAFQDCKTLTEVFLPKKLEQLGTGAFQGCTKLQEIVIPKTLRWIEEGVFEGCLSLKKVVYEGTMYRWQGYNDPTMLFDRELFDSDSLPIIACKDGQLTYSIDTRTWEQI